MTGHIIKEDSLLPDRKIAARKPSVVSPYLKLSKARLSGLVVLTAMAGYAAAPGAFYLMPFAGVAVGTALCSAAANSLNQFLEIPYDSQMARTRNRALVQGHLRPIDAVLFGGISGTTGVLMLATMTNGLTAALGALNIFLYVCIYTPSKRMSIVNTWLGSAVGAIPPLMGWAACTGSIDAAALLLGGILYSWQFPHFNALSWSYRQDYSRAGYRMMAVTDPALCRRVALRHTLAQIPLCILLPAVGATNWWLFVESLPLNGYFAFLAWRFYERSDNKSARDLFRFSLLHLPLLMLLVLINKRRDNTPVNNNPCEVACT